MKYPLYGDVVFVEDEDNSGDYLTRVMRDARSRGAIFRPTIDDWYPNFPDGLVKVRMIPQYIRHRANRFAESEWIVDYWRVLVQGMDSFNFTFEFCHPDQETARRVYMSLPVIISKDDLRSRGFRHV